MDKLELQRKFRLLYKQADFKTRLKIDREIRRVLARNDSEKRLYTAFFKAVKNGNKAAVEKMLTSDERIDINKQDKGLGNTALIYAIVNTDIELVKLLLDLGANPLIKNNKGNDSLDAANIIKENTKLVQLISEYIK
jgi:ankyrin repeat protein